MPFEIVGSFSGVEIIATGHGVRERFRLRARFGGTHWRKMKDVATVALPNGRVRDAELHWYEAHGVGRVRMKIKRFVD